MEIGTSYYRRMMDAFLKHQNISISDFLRKGWEEQSISSYSMGVFGGEDLDFIRRYCLEENSNLIINVSSFNVNIGVVLMR